MQVQQFLREFGLQQLVDQYAIKINDYPDQGIILLNYNSFDSPKKHPIVIECRSLILDRETFEVISRKFDRFFNFGEFEEFYHDFNFDNYYIMSKEDGSLIGFYYNPHTNRFSISTKSLANAEGINSTGKSWYDQILTAGAFKDDNDFQVRMELIPNVKDWTFIFEFVSPYNRIVTPYTEDKLVFIGARKHSGEWMSKETMVEYVHYFESLNIRLPEFFEKPKSILDVVTKANELLNLKEGFVLWDPISNKRIKVKSEKYVIAHTMRGETTTPTLKNIFKLIFTGEADEFLSYFPEYEQDFQRARDSIFRFEYDITMSYYKFKVIEDQKTFALAVKNVPFSFILFTARRDNKHPIKVFYEFDVEKQVKIMGQFIDG